MQNGWLQMVDDDDDGDDDDDDDEHEDDDEDEYEGDDHDDDGGDVMDDGDDDDDDDDAMMTMMMMMMVMGIFPSMIVLRRSTMLKRRSISQYGLRPSRNQRRAMKMILLLAVRHNLTIFCCGITLDNPSPVCARRC